ncbi:hypothetical protein [Sinimarinibacterium flocculans]|uniref:hypothetical protein n=1 Tax=Sinimarinibacterium flocculans TaxID=985250 RepID=UPI003516B073
MAVRVGRLTIPVAAFALIIMAVPAQSEDAVDVDVDAAVAAAAEEGPIEDDTVREPASPRVLLGDEDEKVFLTSWARQALKVVVVNGVAQLRYVSVCVDLSPETDLVVRNARKCTTSGDTSGELLHEGEPFRLRYEEERRTFSVDLAPARISSIGHFLSVATARAGSTRVRIKLTYYDELEGESIPEVQTYEFPIQVRSRLSFQMIGACCGSFVSAFFLVLIRLRNKLEPVVNGQAQQDAPRAGPAPAGSSTRMLVVHSILSWAIAATATCILIALAPFTTAVSFPVALEVRDFVGGGILGLFGQLISVDLAKKFVSKT